ncbi:MAG: hypothetical protein AAGF12_24995, partial [Myxococcota bacterium]
RDGCGRTRVREVEMRGSCLLVLVLCAYGCGDDDPVGAADAGPDGQPDATPFDSSFPDVSVDAPVTDGSPPDATVDADAMVPVEQSRLHAFFPTGILTFTVEDDIGEPLAVDQMFAWNHDGAGGDDLWGMRGDTLYRFVGLNGTVLTFGEAIPLVDDVGNSAAPDIMFTGAFAPGMDTAIGIFGSQIRLLDFGTAAFSPAAAVTDPSSMPFVAMSADTANLGTGPLVVALTTGDPRPFVANGFMFSPGPAPVTCNGAAAITPNLIAGAAIPNLGVTGSPDDVFLVEGTNLYYLADPPTPGQICFSDPFPTVDQAGAAVTPEIIGGFDIMGTGGNDLLYWVDRIMLP